MATTDFVVKNGLVVNENAVILETTDSSSKDTGALVVEGGVGIERRLYVGTDLFVGGDANIAGGDLIVSTAAFNLANTTATTVNFAGAATSVQLGAATGTFTVNNQQTVFNSTDSIQIPVGNTAQRDQTPVVGQIRYNNQLTTFEGYGPGNLWGSLGGVRDVDGNTYIIPELTPGGNQNILYFYNNATLTATLSEINFTLNQNTASTTTSSGALVVVGGAGIGGNLNVGGNQILTGDLAVNGAAITTTSLGTATVFNTGATTVNAFGAATAISIGAVTGTTTIRNANTVVTGDLAVNGADITTTATGTATLFNANATAVNAFGAGTAIAIGAATGTTNFRHNVDIDLDLNVDGGDITTNTATFNLLNTTATTLNAFGAAAALTIGAVTGTATVRNPTVTLSNATMVNVNGVSPTFASTSTGTLTLFNTNLTAVTAFGAAATINIGNATAAQTINIGNASTGASTYNFATAPTATGNTKTVNIGTAGATGSTTNVNIGSAIAGVTTVNSATLVGAVVTQNVFNTLATTVNAFGAAGTVNIGANSGTLTIGNPTVVGTQATVNLWNSTSTTVNFAGAATAVSIGANTGTATLRNPTVVGTQDTVNLWNTTSTTVNAFGAATAVNVGANTGTATLRNPTVVGTQATVNLWNTTSTTVNAFGAATAVNVGANTGTATLRNPTVVGTQDTVNLWNSTSTAVNFAGAATAVSIGATTGTTTINNPELRIGGSDTGNFISFRGTTGDQPGSFNHTYIGERIHAATEASELLIFKGNDPAAGSGPDRVRVFAGEFRVDTYTTAITDTFENTGASASAINRMLITSNGQVTLGANIASTTTGTGTLLVTGGVGVSGAIFANTVNSTVATGTAPLTVASTTQVTNLNANLLNGFTAAAASTINTIAVRDGAGDINVRLVRSEFANQATISGAMAFRVNNTTDNFVRFVSDTPAIRTFLDVPTRTGGNASGTWAINISGNAATVTNGVYTVGDQTIGGIKTFSSTISGSINGNAATATNATNASLMISLDDRIKAPADDPTSRLRFGFTSFANNNTAPYADYLHLRSYTDATGGNDNLVMFRKDTIGMRIWQQAWDSATAYSSFKDIAFTDGTNASGTWGISITGNAASATTATNSNQLGGVAAASFPRSGANNNGDWNFSSNTNNARYDFAAFEIRELNFGGAQTGVVSEAPRIGFHWGGRVASQIAIETSGRMAILNNPGTGYEQLVCSILTATGLSTGATATSGSVVGQWTLGAGSTWQATFADLAEYYPSDEEYEPGTVLVFGGESELTISTQANDRRLAGVVSTNPAYIMNAGCEDVRVCMALQGRVPVKVIGTVERGDMLVSSNVAGYAMVNNEPTYGCVIGKAIESKNFEEPGSILVSINI